MTEDENNWWPRILGAMLAIAILWVCVILFVTGFNWEADNKAYTPSDWERR